MYYLFTRKITKREAINKYGKLGFTTHKEGVVIDADNCKDANDKIAPFNYKKHVRFEFEGAYNEHNWLNQFKKHPDFETIVDLGIVE